MPQHVIHKLENQKTVGIIQFNFEDTRRNSNVQG